MTRRYRAPSVLSLVRIAAPAASMRVVRSQRLLCRAFPDLCLPALSWLPGQIAAQLARCRSLGKKRISTELGDDCLGRARIDPGDRVQLCHLRGERGESPFDFLTHRAVADPCSGSWRVMPNGSSSGWSICWDIEPTRSRA